MLNLKVVKGEGDTELHLVYGEVYAPNRPDAQGEYMTADTIREMAHKFARDGLFDQIDVMHDNNVVNCHIVESFIAQKGDPTYIEGAWVVAVHVPDEGLWDMIKKGELNGFSMESLVTTEEREVEVEIPAVVTGLTSKSDTDYHEHRFFVSYDDEGLVFKGGYTDTVNGHRHVIRAGTHTEEAEGHSHRFSSVDNIEIVG